MSLFRLLDRLLSLLLGPPCCNCNTDLVYDWSLPCRNINNKSNTSTPISNSSSNKHIQAQQEDNKKSNSSKNKNNNKNNNNGSIRGHNQEPQLERTIKAQRKPINGCTHVEGEPSLSIEYCGNNRNNKSNRSNSSAWWKLNVHQQPYKHQQQQQLLQQPEEFGFVCNCNANNYTSPSCRKPQLSGTFALRQATVGNNNRHRYSDSESQRTIRFSSHSRVWTLTTTCVSSDTNSGLLLTSTSSQLVDSRESQLSACQKSAHSSSHTSAASVLHGYLPQPQVNQQEQQKPQKQRTIPSSSLLLPLLLQRRSCFAVFV